MAIERVREYLKQWNAQDRIQEFEVSSATVELAAQALHCEGKRIAKTLSFYQGEECLGGGVIEHVFAGGEDISEKIRRQAALHWEKRKGAKPWKNS